MNLHTLDMMNKGGIHDHVSQVRTFLGPKRTLKIALSVHSSVHPIWQLARYAPIAPWSNCSRENKALKWDRMYEMYLFTVHSTFFLRVLHDTQQTRNGMFHTLRRCSMTRYAEFSKVSLLAPLSMFVTHQSRNQRFGSISFWRGCGCGSLPHLVKVDPDPRIHLWK